MHPMDMKLVVRWVALGALFLIPIMPLVVTSSMFFPFITGKAIYFRILVEVAVSAWVLLALLDARYRPHWSWLGGVVLAFVAWMLIADLWAPNVTKALWSNFERMEGWVLLVHLLGFFFVASNVLRVEKKWREWLLTSLMISALVCVYALLQIAGVAAIHQGSTRIDASFGNSAYLAIYLLFSVCVATWLAITEHRAWLRWSLGALASLQVVLIFFTETRGTILGLMGAVLLAALLTAATSTKRVRLWALGVGLVVLIVAGSFYVFRDAAFIKNNHTLERVTSISLADGQTRFTIWGMALHGAAERPLVGWGQEGFNYVFNKYYEPSLYGQESWFDRAHNAYLDWLTAGGVPAFVLYLALFGVGLGLLWRSGSTARVEKIALTAALAGYAFHNMFVFDNLYSYVYFFALLALIDAETGTRMRIAEQPELSEDTVVTYVLPGVGILLLACLWWVNLRIVDTSTSLIAAMSRRPDVASIDTNIAAFTKLLAVSPPMAQEVREQLVQFAATAVGDGRIAEEERRRAASLAISEMRKHTAAYPEDARIRLQLAYAYRMVGEQKLAMDEVLAAAALSTEKPEMWIEAGSTAWDGGDEKAAQGYFAKAYELNQAPALAAYAAAGEMAVGNMSAADALLMRAFGTTTVDQNVLAVAYFRSKNWPRLIAVWQLRTQDPAASGQTWFSLAAAYYAAGDRTQAIATLRTAMQRYPEAAEAGTAAIKQIQAGQ